MVLETNERWVVEVLLQCQPTHPPAEKWRVDHLGRPFLLPGVGGITLNVQVGDPAFGWAGDHVEPGVSCSGAPGRAKRFPNPGVQFYACAGNPAVLVSGAAKGAKGTVLGHHGGSEHLIVDFPPEVCRRLTYDDKIVIHAKGQGLRFTDHLDVRLINLAPSLLRKLRIRRRKDGRLEVPVTTVVPSECMGSGIGDLDIQSGDYDIMTSDSATVSRYALDRIRLGDFVGLLDQDNIYGRTHRKGAVTVGIVVHSDSNSAGHGPGVTTLMSATDGLLVPVLDPKANIADRLGIGTARRGRRATGRS